jgi:hypothetical protein
MCRAAVAFEVVSFLSFLGIEVLSERDPLSTGFLTQGVGSDRSRGVHNSVPLLGGVRCLAGADRHMAQRQ